MTARVDAQALGASLRRLQERHATVLESADTTMREALSWVRDGTVAAFAGNRQRLGATAVRGGVPGLHLLPDNIYAVPQAIAVPQDRPDLLARVDAALNAMRASGLLEQAVQRSGADGIAVAPALEEGAAPAKP